MLYGTPVPPLDVVKYIWVLEVPIDLTFQYILSGGGL
jgi:hypothetical protein